MDINGSNNRVDTEKIKAFFKKEATLPVVILVVIIAVLVGVAFGFFGKNPSVNPPLGKPDRDETVIAQEGATPQANSQPDFTPSTSDEARVIAVVKMATPAVVSIVADKDLTIVENPGFNPFQDLCGDSFFRQFLGDQCGGSQQQQPRSRTQRQTVSAGSGFTISSDGLILTNKHVIDIPGADFTVITSDNKKFKAHVLAKDPVRDLAVIKIDGSGFPSLPLGNSDRVQIGQTVIAIGNALGQFSNTVSKGVVSGLSRSIVANSGGGSSERLDQVIQTDAAINPGNSGGPLLNLSGEVIGVNSAIVQGAQNIGFAIPINQAKKDINQVKTLGKISVPFLGVRYVLVTPDVKAQNDLPVDYGALIVGGRNPQEVAITPGSPADKAGIRENDIILEINGKRLSENNDLARALQNLSVGDRVTLKILSRGAEKTVSLTLDERR